MKFCRDCKHCATGHRIGGGADLIYSYYDGSLNKCLNPRVLVVDATYGATSEAPRCTDIRAGVCGSTAHMWEERPAPPPPEPPKPSWWHRLFGSQATVTGNADV